MVAAGWCPSFRYSDRARTSTYWWYASSLKPFIRHHQHEHIGCSEDGCIAHSIDETTYRTLHLDAECSCPFLSPPIDSLRKILQSGCIPIISYTDGALEVHPASSALPSSANCKNSSNTLWVPGSVGSAARFAKYWERYYFSWEGAGRSCKEAQILRRSSLISQGINALAEVRGSLGGCRLTHKGSD